jgi:hypothetical protein
LTQIKTPIFFQTTTTTTNNNKKHKQERKLRYSQKMNPAVYNSNNEKVLVIGNRLANLNYKKEQDALLTGLHQSHEALETLLASPPNNNHVPQQQSNHYNHINSNSQQNSIKNNPPLSQNSLHVDSAVSISGVSQQSTPPPIPPSSPTSLPQQQAQAPPPPPPAQPQLPPGPPRDDAQMIDFVSSFLFPISFVIFNIIYWMVYLNMQVLSSN